MEEENRCIYYPKFSCSVQKWIGERRSISDKLQDIPKSEADQLIGAFSKMIEKTSSGLFDNLVQFCDYCPHKERLNEIIPNDFYKGALHLR